MPTQIKPHVFIYQHQSYLHNNTIVIVQPDHLIIIDPSFNLNSIFEKYQYQKLTLVLTHAHSDHTGPDFMTAIKLANQVIASFPLQELLNESYFDDLFFGLTFKHELPQK